MKVFYNFLLVLLCISICQTFTIAQNAFQYQAVVRDSTGQVLPNQPIGIEAAIIQIDPNLPAVYQEEHQVYSNDYGVINIEVGRGVPTEGAFETIEWSLKNFLQINIDIEGGNNYTLSSTSEILSAPKALYAERAGSIEGDQFGLLVTNFGAKGDGQTDDTQAFEQALDSAAILGCKVLIPSGIYKITRTLLLKGGVSMIGEGSGSDPLETPFNGSLIWYFGEGFAIKINGHNTRIRDIVLRDKSENAEGGILVKANNRLVESIHLDNLIISGFVNGTALKLHSKNNGGIYFGSYNNVRIRHGKIGIHILQGENSYINSNTWNHCLISGGAFRYGMLIEGGNNNNFNGVIIEPYSSEKGHLHLKSGQIFGNQMRIEGIQQDETVPLIYFNKKTKSSILTGVYAGGLTLDKGNNFINMQSGKAIHYKNSSFNKFKNAVFFSPDNETLYDWDIEGNYTNFEILPPELSEQHNVLKLTIPAGESVRLEPSALSRPQIKDLPLYDQVNFGFYVKAFIPEFAHTFTNAIGGWTRSTYHSGTGEWEFVGMNASVERQNQSRFTLQISNPSSEEQDIYITSPTLNFGNQLPTLDEPPLLSSGGQLYGLLIPAYADALIPDNGFLDLPKTANYFALTGTNNIYRINHETANRFPRGSVITLLFNETGIGVSNGGYLNLKSGFTSVANGSLTLISNGNGTWREVDRND